MVLGNELLGFCSRAQAELVLCAPFAKAHVLRRLLADVHSEVDLTLITRWRPEEIATGVSDLEVLDLLAARSGRVLLHDRLHAKFYRSDDRVLLGSANLTGAALGWTAPSNLELLTVGQPEDVRTLESRLLADSILATEELAEELRDIAAELSGPPLPDPDELSTGHDSIADAHAWLPGLRQPSDLWSAYRGGCENLTTIARSAALIDLSFLDVPPGLEHGQFNRVVGSRLLQHPFIHELDEFVANSQRFGAVRDFLMDRRGVDREDAELTWQTLMRWLLEFLPSRYSVQTFNWSEVIQRQPVPKEHA